jgi:hypothetical protein
LAGLVTATPLGIVNDGLVVVLAANAAVPGNVNGFAMPKIAVPPLYVSVNCPAVIATFPAPSCDALAVWMPIVTFPVSAWDPPVNGDWAMTFNPESTND